MNKDILDKHKNDPTWAEVIRLYSGLFETQQEREDFVIDLTKNNILLAAECKSNSIDEENGLVEKLTVEISESKNNSSDKILSFSELNLRKPLIDCLKKSKFDLLGSASYNIVERSSDENLLKITNSLMALFLKSRKKATFANGINLILQNTTTEQFNSLIANGFITTYLNYLIAEKYFAYASELIVKKEIPFRNIFPNNLENTIEIFLQKVKGSIQQYKRLKFAIFLMEHYDYEHKTKKYYHISKYLINKSYLKKGSFRSKYASLKSEIEYKYRTIV